MSWYKHHSESEQFAIAAEISDKQGNTDRAKELYRLAAEAEMRALIEINPEKARTIGITVVSATALYYKAGEYQRAQAMAEEWLSKSDIPAFALDQLSTILQTLKGNHSLNNTLILESSLGPLYLKDTESSKAARSGGISPSELVEFVYLQPFIQATITSSSRFRRVLIVLIITSILAFTASWNARQGSWLNSRIDRLYNAEKFLTAKEELANIEKEIGSVEAEISQIPKENEAKKTSLEERIGNLKKEQQQAQEIINGTSSDVREWVDQRNLTNKEQLASFIQELEKARIEAVTLFRVPFFGIAIDINDLGLLSGITFVIILMWLRFSLWREYYNLTSTFEEAKSSNLLEFCYKTLAMNQVLTVPHALSPDQSRKNHLEGILRVLYLFPLLVQLNILAYDFYSFKVGWLINKFNTVLSITTSLCFLVISALLTYWCLQLSYNIDKEWDKAARLVWETSKSRFG